MTLIDRELSMKEKAEAYDKALKKFRQFMDGYSKREISKEELEDIFPGFLEPEDEKIRKDIISYIKAIANNKNISPDSKKECKTWISWLEKQGENKKEMNNFDVLPGLYICTRRMYDRRTLDGKILFEVGNTYKCLSKHDKAEFEVSYGKSVYLEDPVVYRYFIPYIEQDDPKPTDTVKPVFEVGDWVVNKLGNIWHIDSFDAENYQVTTTKGEHNHFPVNIQNRMRSWTIRDAKDGDVLHSIGWHNDCIFIFNGLDNWKFDEPNGDRAVATGYCCLSVSADKMEFGMQGPDCIEVNTIKPATNIQRDLLFQKMYEAGYEWDADKKELRKMENSPILSNSSNIEKDEQKPADKVEPKFKVGDRITKSSKKSCPVNSSTDDTVCEVAEVHDTCYILNTGEGRIQVPLEWQDNYELVKPTWSEEDESILNGIMNYLCSHDSCELEGFGEWYDWLKSLKDRYTWKPSKEQIIALRWVLNNVPYNKYKEEISGLLDQIKDL